MSRPSWWMPFDAVGDPKEPAVRILTPNLEPDDISIERHHARKIVNAQRKFPQERYRLSRHMITPSLHKTTRRERSIGGHERLPKKPRRSDSAPR